MADLADRAQLQIDRNLEDALSAHQARVQSTQVKNLKRVCVDCGERIAVRRLKAMPFAKRCAEHEAAHEKLQRNYRRA